MIAANDNKQDPIEERVPAHLLLLARRLDEALARRRRQRERASTSENS